MRTNKILIVAFTAVAIGLLLYPPTLNCFIGTCRPDDHQILWAFRDPKGGEYKVDLLRLAIYELVLAIAAGATYFIRKK